jgi:radical SAM protein with 4Fe4S-binding SPASM domain
MKVIAAIEADLLRSPLGTSSRLREDLAGTPILRRTLGRVRQARRLASVHVVTSLDQKGPVTDLLAGLGVAVEAHDAGPPPWQERVRHARKWALDGWRGGVGGLCAFDECIHAGALGALGRRERADAVASVPAAAVLLDPAMLDAMVEHLEKLAEDTRIVFAQTPPGLSAFLARPDILDELYGAGHPPGALLTYIPDNPQLDLTTKPCCYVVPSIIAETSARLLADTRRGIELLTNLLAGHDERTLSAERICEWIVTRRTGHLDRLPREVELELTTDDQLVETSLRPRGKRVPSRGPASIDLVRRMAEELGQYDDSLLLLGGFGEPLLHPELAEVLRTCRETGVFGLAVRTNGIALHGDIIDRLIDHDVDVVNVTVDAHTAESYRLLNNADAFDQVAANIEGLSARRRERRVGPLIVPEMAKLGRTLTEQEAFFDHWLRRVGWANIVSPSHYARQLPAQETTNMAPPRRSRCGRLWSRLVVLADGTVTTCDQDFAARQSIGQVNAESLEALWTGPKMTAIRNAHASLSPSDLPLCPACDEWHRP